MIEKSDVQEAFPGRLKLAREIRQLSQAALAVSAGLPQSSIAHFEAGARKPSFDNLRRLANALEVTTDYLLGRSDGMDAVKLTDPLYRDVAKLTTQDRELARDFLRILVDRTKPKG